MLLRRSGAATGRYYPHPRVELKRAPKKSENPFPDLRWENGHPVAAISTIKLFPD
jgi:hypothetical protein